MSEEKQSQNESPKSDFDKFVPNNNKDAKSEKNQKLAFVKPL
jgi:hypothetical protein